MHTKYIKTSGFPSTHPLSLQYCELSYLHELELAGAGAQAHQVLDGEKACVFGNTSHLKLPKPIL
jgi:hypothetical protein